MVFEYLDHKSDAYVHVSAGSLKGIFEDSATAAFEIMLDTSSVKEAKAVEVEINADDLEQLLYMWVDRLLYIFDADSFAVRRAEIKSLKAIKGAFSLLAKLHGEEYDPASHDQRSGVKAMTYSLMRIFKEKGCWQAYFVLDI